MSASIAESSAAKNDSNSDETLASASEVTTPPSIEMMFENLLQKGLIDNDKIIAGMLHLQAR